VTVQRGASNDASRPIGTEARRFIFREARAALRAVWRRTRHVCDGGRESDNKRPETPAICEPEPAVGAQDDSFRTSTSVGIGEMRLNAVGPVGNLAASSVCRRHPEPLRQGARI
jgi:hypothetical protein